MAHGASLPTGEAPCPCPTRDPSTRASARPVPVSACASRGDGRRSAWSARLVAGRRRSALVVAGRVATHRRSASPRPRRRARRDPDRADHVLRSRLRPRRRDVAVRRARSGAGRPGRRDDPRPLLPGHDARHDRPEAPDPDPRPPGVQADRRRSRSGSTAAAGSWTIDGIAATFPTRRPAPGDEDARPGSGSSSAMPAGALLLDQALDGQRPRPGRSARPGRGSRSGRSPARSTAIAASSGCARRSPGSTRSTRPSSTCTCAASSRPRCRRPGRSRRSGPRRSPPGATPLIGSTRRPASATSTTTAGPRSTAARSPSRAATTAAIARHGRAGRAERDVDRQHAVPLDRRRRHRGQRERVHERRRQDRRRARVVPPRLARPGADDGTPYDAGAPRATWQTAAYTLDQLSAVFGADPRTNVGPIDGARPVERRGVRPADQRDARPAASARRPCPGRCSARCSTPRRRPPTRTCGAPWSRPRRSPDGTGARTGQLSRT